MAEVVFQRIIERENASDRFHIDSAGLIAYHAGEQADSRMRLHASRRGYTITHRSRPFRRSDFDTFDLIIGMDDQNITGLKNLAHTPDESRKIVRVTDFCRNFEADHVPDPYYGGEQGFEYVIDLLEDACEGLYASIKKQELTAKD